jgi:carbon monoxide dehydrogenase subunit G
MNMTGERFIAAPRVAVWAALNDPEVLKACIPGCESLEKLSDTQMKAVAGIKLGPVSAKFQGQVTLSDLDPPNGYRISGEGKGGPAGFAKGGAEVRLVDHDAGTLLSYTVDAQVGGKIAQVGARLIDATAKTMAEQFFKKFAASVEKPEPPMPSAAPAVPQKTAPHFFARLWRSIARLFSGS